MDSKITLQKALKIKQERLNQMESLWSTLSAGTDAVSVCKQASDYTDVAVKKCWDLSDMPSCCALIATGGYGRGALWPLSDVDVMVLAPSEEYCSESDLHSAMERLAAVMWDAGLDPGLVARRVGECKFLAMSDITIRCAMLERRIITGSDECLNELSKELDSMDSFSFYSAKMREQRERHSRHGDSPFGLEPNLKEAPGGLRDLQMPMWVARTMGIEASWDGLKKAGLLTGGEAELAAACEARLSLLRAMLHKYEPRCGEKLTFQAQSTLASVLGIGIEADKTAAETMMDGFFACARNTVMINEVLLQGMSERFLGIEQACKTNLSSHFYKQGGLLWVNSEDVFAKNPSSLFEAFEWLQKDDSINAMSSKVTRALWRASRRVDAWFRADKGNRIAFLNMLKSKRRVVTEISRMARVGLLGAYIPAFGKAETLMQHDLFHAYTVGRHTLGVIRNLRRFSKEDRAHEMPLLSEISEGFKDFWLLYVAALFHDIAKGRGGRHEEKGVKDVMDFCSAHSIQEEDAELCAFLVKNHLEMSRISQKKDIQDPDVIADFSYICKNKRYLDALYMLTVADMKATGPTVWNEWKGTLLESLWRQTSLSLSGHFYESKNKVQTMRSLALSSAIGHGASSTQAEEYVSSLDEVYFLRTTEEECSWHAKVLAQACENVTCVVEVNECRVKIAVWCSDRRGLFFKICSAMSQAGLGVLAAKLSSNRSGFALDSFDAEDFHAQGNRKKREVELASLIKKTILAEERHEPRLGRCSARARHAGAIAQAKVSAAGKDWLVEVDCVDRSGVLWTIADVFEKKSISVKSARVAIVGERAEDVFVVYSNLLISPEFRLDLESELVQRLSV